MIKPTLFTLTDQSFYQEGLYQPNIINYGNVTQPQYPIEYEINQASIEPIDIVENSIPYKEPITTMPISPKLEIDTNISQSGTSIIDPFPVDTTVTGISPTGTGTSAINPAPIKPIINEVKPEISILEPVFEDSIPPKEPITTMPISPKLEINPVIVDTTVTETFPTEIGASIIDPAPVDTIKKTDIKLNKKPNYWIYIIIGGTILYLFTKKNK